MSSWIAPMGQVQPQKLLLERIVSKPTNVKMEIKIIGMLRPAFKKRNGFSMTHMGLGCSPIPLPNSPKGNKLTTPNAKNARAIITNRTGMLTFLSFKRMVPIIAKAAATHIFDSPQNAKNPGAF